MLTIRISTVFLILSTLFLQNCTSVKSVDIDTEIKTPEVEIRSEENRRVEFQGISFTYDSNVFGKVTSKEIPEQRLDEPDRRPDYVAPKHIQFTFDLGREGWEAMISIYPIKDFPQMYAVNKESVRATKKEIDELRKVLKDKDFRSDGEIPYIPFVDAGQDFQTNVKLSHFNNGNGIFFSTYMSTEYALVSNDHLRYIFEGLTNDGENYILAEIPISAKFLPDDSPEEFEGYERAFLLEDYSSRNNVKKRYKDYISSITTRLEKMGPEEFQPDLRKLEEIIASLKIEK